MRKCLLSLMLALAAVIGVQAADVTFTFADMCSGSTVTELSKDGITATVAKGNSSTAPAYNANAGELRLYAGTASKIDGNTMTVASSGAAITKIVFVPGTTQFTMGAVSANVGTVTVGTDKTVEWVGNATEVTFTVSRATASVAAQYRAKAMTVTTGGSGVETVSDPKISPASGVVYTDKAEITLSCSTTGATIYYTTNGTEPTAQSAAYTAPFSLDKGADGKATVKAIAIKGELKSAVVTATYEFKTPASVENIAAYQKLADSTYVKFASPVTVIAQNAVSMYVKDASGYALFYGQTGKTYNTGDVIPAGFVGEKVTYGGEPELQNLAGFADAAGTETVTAEAIQPADVAADMFGHYVVLNGAKLSGINGKSFNVTWNGGTAAGFSNMGVTVPKDSTTLFDIKAVIGSYRAKGATETTYNVVPLEFVNPNSGVKNIAAFNALADSSEVVFSNPVTVLYQKGSYLYVKDATGCMLVYGSLGQNYNAGDVIPAGFKGKKVTYDCEPELISPSDFKASTKTETVEAEVLALTAVNHDNFGHYVLVKGVTIDGSNLTDGTNQAAFYNKFGINVPSDGKKYDVYGIVGSHGKTNAVYQILPIKFVGEGGEVGVTEVENLKALLNMGQNTPAKLKNAITVIYQNGKYMYVKDGSATALVFGTLTNKYNNGDQITGAVASWKANYGVPELIPVDSTFAAGVAGAAVTPEEITLEEISTDMVNNYFLVKDVTITAGSKDNKYVFNDGTVDAEAFNRFAGNNYDKQVVVPTDLTKKYNVEVFVSLYSGKVELYPVKFVDASGVEGIDADGVNVTVAGGVISSSVAAKVYNMAGVLVGEGTIVKVPAGVYVVKARAKVVKVLAK